MFQIKRNIRFIRFGLALFKSKILLQIQIFASDSGFRFLAWMWGLLITWKYVNIIQYKSCKPTQKVLQFTMLYKYVSMRIIFCLLTLYCVFYRWCTINGRSTSWLLEIVPCVLTIHCVIQRHLVVTILSVKLSEILKVAILCVNKVKSHALNSIYLLNSDV